MAQLKPAHLEKNEAVVFKDQKNSKIQSKAVKIVEDNWKSTSIYLKTIFKI